MHHLGFERIMHTKLFTFSTTKDPNGVLRDHVVWFGSANMTHATGAKTFNNTITIYGDQELYQSVNGYFAHLFDQKHYAGNDYYDADARGLSRPPRRASTRLRTRTGISSTPGLTTSTPTRRAVCGWRSP